MNFWPGWGVAEGMSHSPRPQAAASQRPPGVPPSEWLVALEYVGSVAVTPLDSLRICKEPGGPLWPSALDEEAQQERLEDPEWLAEIEARDWEMALEVQASRNAGAVS